VIKRTVYLDHETAKRVRQVAISTGRSQSEVIREALRGSLHSLQRPRPKGVGGYQSGRSDVSDTAEAILGDAVKSAAHAATAPPQRAETESGSAER